MTRRWVRSVGVALALAIAAFVVLSTGVVNVAASSGHWPVTAWLLHYTMRRSVVTRAVAIREPPLDDPALIVRGAGHYASGCAPCHGEPGVPRGAIVRHMTPQAPAFDPGFTDWRARELFWIVKHGIKYTAMPAWPARGRDDEVWAIVAFLRQLPQLSSEDYRTLAYGDHRAAGNGGIEGLGADDPMLAECVRCHGRDGTGRGVDAFPRLDIQPQEYLYTALASYAQGTRPSGIMQSVAQSLDRPTLRRLAQYFARPDRLEAATSAAVHTAAAHEPGRRLAEHGNPRRGVPACDHCHGARRIADNPAFPRLAGQNHRYLATQLELFRSGARGGGPYAALMHEVADGLEPDEIDAVARWYASLPASGTR